MGTPTIEPYSLRRTRDGNILLHAVLAENHHHRSYRLDRIVGARATARTFVPLYAVELSPASGLSIPATFHPPVAQVRSVRPAC